MQRRSLRICLCLGVLASLSLAGCPQTQSELVRENTDLREQLETAKAELNKLQEQAADSEYFRSIVLSKEKIAAEALESLVNTAEEKSQVIQRNADGHVVGVDLTAARAKKTDLFHLESLVFLERLKAALPDVNDDSLKHVKHLKHLKVLDLEGSAISDTGAETISLIASLEDVNLKRTGIDAAFSHLKRMPKLKRIRAAQTDITDASLEQLAGMNQLELLDFRDCTNLSDMGLEHLKNLKKLKDLKVWGTSISSMGLEHLGGLSNLRVLSLQDTRVDDSGLEKLAGFTKMQDLTLFRTYVTDLGMPALSKLTELRRLNLRGTMVGGKGMEHVAKLKNLQRLDLSETITSNDGLAYLHALPELEDLNLWGARVGDDGMQHVASIVTLKRLNLDNVGFPSENVQLTDEGVKKLTPLENLEWLHLGKTQVGAAGVEALAELPNLKELVITFCPNIDDESVQKLMAARPNLKITR